MARNCEGICLGVLLEWCPKLSFIGPDVPAIRRCDHHKMVHAVPLALFYSRSVGAARNVPWSSTGTLTTDCGVCFSTRSDRPRWEQDRSTFGGRS